MHACVRACVCVCVCALALARVCVLFDFIQSLVRSLDKPEGELKLFLLFFFSFFSFLLFLFFSKFVLVKVQVSFSSVPQVDDRLSRCPCLLLQPTSPPLTQRLTSSREI